MLNNILLIDDDDDEHLFFQWTAEKISNDLCLLHAYSSKQAVNMLQQVAPDIIFLDINLPGNDGFECLKEIRQITACDDIPIYMYSTEISEMYKKKAQELGASGTLKKSRTTTNFINTMERILI
jgi:CheY-like chemotaxis protein